MRILVERPSPVAGIGVDEMSAAASAYVRSPDATAHEAPATLGPLLPPLPLALQLAASATAVARRDEDTCRNT